MKLYTKTGDQGSSSNFGAGRMSKTSEIFEISGSIDHLNSIFGWVTSLTNGQDSQLLLPITPKVTLFQSITTIQHLLFDIGAWISKNAESISASQRAHSLKDGYSESNNLTNSLSSKNSGTPQLSPSECAGSHANFTQPKPLNTNISTNFKEKSHLMPVSEKLHILLSQETTRLEIEIDHATAAAPPLRNFALPGGIEITARLHIARTTTRNTERTAWRCLPQPTNIHAYLNRLSDWCFAIARLTLHHANKPDRLWKPS